MPRPLASVPVTLLSALRKPGCGRSGVREERRAGGAGCGRSGVPLPFPKAAAAPVLPGVPFPQPRPPEPGFRTMCPSRLYEAVREYSMTNVMGSQKLTGWIQFLVQVDICYFRMEGPLPCEVCHFL